jgi:hypothetical protein
MPRRATKAIIHGRAIRRDNHIHAKATRRKSAAKRTQLSRSRARVQVKYRGAKISRARLRNMQQDLERANIAVVDTFEKFWVMPETNIRETLGRTKQTIGRAVEMLQRAA